MDSGSRDDSTVQDLYGRIGSNEAKIVEFFRFNTDQILKCRLSVFEASSLLYGSIRGRTLSTFFEYLFCYSFYEACVSDTTIVVK